MTRSETGEIIGVIKACWPHSNLGAPRDVVSVWHGLLGKFPPADVQAAVTELAATGREHAPPPGLVLATLTERATDAPDWDEAWREIDRLIRHRGRTNPPTPGHFSHPLIAEFAIPAWRELCDAPAPGVNGHGTHFAQQREAYRAMRARLERGVALHAVGAARRRPLPRPFANVLTALPQLPGGPTPEEA